MRRTLINTLAAVVIAVGGFVAASPARATVAPAPDPSGPYCCWQGGKLACCGNTGAACFSNGNSWCY